MKKFKDLLYLFSPLIIIGLLILGFILIGSNGGFDNSSEGTQPEDNLVAPYEEAPYNP